MTTREDDILRLRLANQQLAAQRFDTPRELVHHFGAVQSQDFGAARWAVGLRLPSATAASVEAAFANGEILRTHVLRPTWHFVAPEDIRWLLALTAPRVKAVSRSSQRAIGLDEPILSRANEVIARTLEGGQQLTRPELADALRRAGVENVSNPTMGHIMANAELDGVVCSGARRGKQHTYALLDERVPAPPARQRDEAVVELTKRYFTSHGPATLRDFAWWSGLTVTDARRGIALADCAFEQITAGEQTYWWAPAPPSAARRDQTQLLPIFDEYTVAYTPASRALMCDAARVPAAELGTQQAPVPLTNVVVERGRAIGVWHRGVEKDRLALSVTWFDGMRPPDEFQRTVQHYAMFLGLGLRS